MLTEALKGIEERFAALETELADPDILSRQQDWQKLVRERATLEPIITAIAAYRTAEKQRQEGKELLHESDAEMKALAQEEIEAAEADLEKWENELRFLLLPKDPNDERNVMLEIRAGTGGEEAALFASDLLRMYTRYAERTGLKSELMYSNETQLGGIKEAELRLSGKAVYSKMKYESGAHRVQRVPETESQGRIQTSAATVVVLPEAEELDVEIKPNDLRIDTYRASGAGGQHVNTTDSAIRITHLPTGIVVQCMDERSQHKNRDKAMKVLKTRLWDHYQNEQHAEQAAERKSLVGSGDRSERIRTYNFPQGRVTDHRIGLTLYKLEAFLDGDMDEMLEALALADRTAQLEALGSE